eukprot:695134_1
MGDCLFCFCAFGKIRHTLYYSFGVGVFGFKEDLVQLGIVNMGYFDLFVDPVKLLVVMDFSIDGCSVCARDNCSGFVCIVAVVVMDEIHVFYAHSPSMGFKAWVDFVSPYLWVNVLYGDI